MKRRWTIPLTSYLCLSFFVITLSGEVFVKRNLDAADFPQIGRKASGMRRRFVGAKERKEKIKNQAEISSKTKAASPDLPRKQPRRHPFPLFSLC